MESGQWDSTKGIAHGRNYVFSYLTIIKITVTLLVSLVLAIFYYSNNIHSLIEWVSGSEKENRVLGMVLTVLVISVLISVFIPLEPMVVSISYLLSKAYGNNTGVFASLAIAISSIEISSIMCVYMTRLLISKSLEKMIKENAYFDTVNVTVKERGILLVMLIRLTPLIPFSMTNYLLGVTDIGYFSLFVGNLGSIPISTFFVFLGISASNIQFLEYKVSRISFSSKHGVVMIFIMLLSLVSIFFLFNTLIDSYRKISNSDNSYVFLGEKRSVNSENRDFNSPNSLSAIPPLVSI